jgi:hypothetical protein
MTKHEAIKLGRMRYHDDRHQFIAWLEQRLRKLYKENINLNTKRK